MNAEVTRDCGCAGPDDAVDLVRPPANPPGLAALAYRVGVHGSFAAAMTRALGADPVLRRLGTREGDDPLIALLDAGSSMLDVLTFYQERIANEGFLRTATERLSVLELARAIGYELRPGVAASTTLAFTLSRPPAVVEPPSGVDLPVAAHAVTTPPVVRIGAGARVQSVPGQDELPRTFETVENIEARPEWNSLRVPVVGPASLLPGDPEVYLAGTATGLNPGDLLLLVGDERLRDATSGNWEVRRVTALRTAPRAGSVAEHTVVTLDLPLDRLTQVPVQPARENPQVYALRARASVFGHNAMPWNTLPASLRVGELVPQAGANPIFVPGAFAGRQHSWADAAFPSGTTRVALDRTYPGLAPGGWAVLATPSGAELFGITDVTEVIAADYLLSAQVSRLTLAGENLTSFSPVTATVFTQSELLPVAGRPITTPVQGHTIELAEQITGLSPGRFVAIRGSRQDTGATASEAHRLTAVLGGARTTLVLAEDLTHRYLPDSVRISANAAPATDGESRTELLGSGNSAAWFQAFTLSGTPLTYVSATTPSGGASTLQIRVDGVRWTEVDSLYGQPPTARVYTTRRADDGTVLVRFGDGRTGARLPSGTDNVVASYRVGTGAGGNLEPGRLNLLLTRPLGVDEVINPAPAAGGADPEQLAAARRNAPTTVLTLDRIVSLQDYEDFARSFSGIGKARADAQWNGERRLVRIVIAGTDGRPVDPASALYANLLAAIDAARHQDHQVLVAPHRSRPFTAGLKVTVDRDRRAGDVFAAVTAALTATFAFDRRDFGQPVTAGEVLAAVQSVTGVRGAVLTSLSFAGKSSGTSGGDPILDKSFVDQSFAGTGIGGKAAVSTDLLTAAAADLLTLGHLGFTELTEPLP